MVTVNSGQLPSAKGLDGYDLAQVVGKWQSIAQGRFREDCSSLIQMIDETDRYELWKKNTGGFTYESRDEFLREQVLIDYDLTESSLTEIVSRLRGGEKVTLTAAEAKYYPLAEKPGPGGDGYIITNSSERGTDKTYTLRRLARDNPELLDRVESGELSANAAAIEAGFRRKMFSVPADSYDDAIAAVNKYYKQ